VAAHRALGGKLALVRADAVVGDLAAQGSAFAGDVGIAALGGRDPRSPTDRPQKQRDAWKGYLRAAIKRYARAGTTGAVLTETASRQTALPDQNLADLDEANLKTADEPPKPASYAKLLTLSHTVIIRRTEASDVRGPPQPPTRRLTAWTFLRDIYQHPAPGAHSRSWPRMRTRPPFRACSRSRPHPAHDGRHGQGRALWGQRGRLGLGPGRNGGYTRGMQGQRKSW